MDQYELGIARGLDARAKADGEFYVSDVRKESELSACVLVSFRFWFLRLDDEGVGPQISQITQMEKRGLRIIAWADFVGRRSSSSHLCNLCNLRINLLPVSIQSVGAGALQSALLGKIGVYRIQLGDQLGRARTSPERVIKNRYTSSDGISAEMALRLSEALGTSAEHWARMLRLPLGTGRRPRHNTLNTLHCIS